MEVSRKSQVEEIQAPAQKEHLPPAPMLYAITAFKTAKGALFLFAGSSNAFGYILAPVPLLAPAIFMILHIFVAFVQAFVFTILPVIYLSGAVAEGH